MFQILKTWYILNVANKDIFMISQASWNWEANRQNSLKSEDSPTLVEKITSTNNKASALEFDVNELEDKYIHEENQVCLLNQSVRFFRRFGVKLHILRPRHPAQEVGTGVRHNDAYLLAQMAQVFCPA
jgi:hypothetical protein